VQAQAEKDLRTIPEEKFKQGQAWTFEVTFPKEGYKGNPVPVDRRPRPPTGPEDFQTRFLRVEMRQVRKRKDSTRVVFRVDETDERGVTKAEALYFLYLDVYEQGLHVLWRGEDDNGDREEDAVLHNMPFPFWDARPLMFSFLQKDHDGYLGYDRRGAIFRKIGEKDGATEVEVTHIRADIKKPRGVTWYQGDDAAAVLKDRENTRVYWIETQKWAKADDWLWTEMERHATDGTLLVRCLRIEIPKDAEKPEPPKDEKPK